MSNILEYLKWRGDLTLSASEFNEVDNLILARLSYFYLDEIVENNKEITIKQAYEKYNKLNKSKIRILQKEDSELFSALAQSKRFSGMRLTNFVNKIDAQEEKQFAAVTIIMPDYTIYVSYRGTDNTIVGWKEDLNMSFQKHVPAQIAGIKYLEQTARMYPYRLRVGGHSKGGNIAIYSSAFADKAVQNRIIKIYNNDGPGVDDEIATTKEYIDIISKVNTYVPQTSIIGMLLSHEEKYTVVQSTQKGIMQHDLYTWQVIGKEFVHLDEVDSGSVMIDRTIKTWLKEVDIEQRKEFINIIFKILEETKAKTLSEIRENWVKNIGVILKSYQNIDPKNKEMIIKTVETLVKIIMKETSPNVNRDVSF